MPAVRKSRRSVEEGVRTELQQIRAQVAGVRGSLVATSDGLVVAHDIPDVEPTQIAALAAATLAVARRATLATECGTFREGIWSLLKRSIANFAAADLDGLVRIIKRKLKKIQYRPHLIDGCLAATGLRIEPW